ncbi:L-aspartate oxidase [Sulfurospirillum barnesii]|uniref:L-aspartate oxidase n=1 Tax=Sulfurospirillum barnesii (strain ATCC 700032 / DSM 10660 / SES-3) TaxID=760154 RepID=I3XVI1_SULBS|nr:L-aspartate oxidase [Sulfurospirillum barnesii]AFL67955.1 L-aspartate oxidase [Sulfurospirillum barnesii SES-3]
MKTSYDVLIIGTGIAGLSAALALPKTLNVLLIAKDYAWECNTFYAQGGVAVAKDDADIALHVKDTLEAGAGHCNAEAVNVLCAEGPRAISKLIDSGFEFDKDASGQLLYTKEAAHSTNRILHAGGDATGRYIHLFLMQQLPFPILYNTQVTDLLIKEGECFGARVFHNDKIFNLYAKKVIIASGGVGSLYEYHTNARTISADMQGICLSHGIQLDDMEMMQFHPTVFVLGKSVRKQLLSESLRGEGAMIVDEDGKRFVFEYDKRGELAPRDVVSRAIFGHKQKTGKNVFLDLSAFSPEHFKERFPSIYFNMQNMGYDVPAQRVPISPAFHYSMGGIKTNLHAEVLHVKDLYAIGECAHTGVHGANRLASNSLLEGLVFALRVAHAVEISIDNAKEVCLFSEEEHALMQENDKTLKNELRDLMWCYAGILRNKEGLGKAYERVEAMLKLPIGRLLTLRLLVSKEIITSALRRKKSLGAHYLSERKM